MTFPYLKLPFDPLPDPAAVVLAPHVRFTVLTSRLLRLEWSATDQFEDRPSQAFWFRRQPLPEFTQQVTPAAVEIDTGYLHLRYRLTGRGFTPNTLSVTVKDTNATWYYGDAPWRGGNLGGTARTLDQAVGTVELEPGLVGRNGWAVYNDSANLVFNNEGWVEARSNPNNLDLYFFGYGHDYAACQQDFCKLAGPAPIPPRWALGNWWSRYWAYSADELLDLMHQFQAHRVPLSVCIIDMDWHITSTGNHSSGWTGYTWNKTLFPDPPAFLKALHDLGLKTSLNLHPAEGIHPHEAAYPEMAQAMGLDPSEQEPVPFDVADLVFMDAYLKLLHHPLEAQGVDFWWMDWQQGKQARLPGLDPLWWLNHVHFFDLARDEKRRSFIFSRWGGLGNHRYPIGFSGDTIIGWEALQHLPPFTSTAANVGYGWWSHDIGGHMGGIEEDELYARWVQYGVFSPILRLHSTNAPYHERRPWERGPAAERAASNALRLRHRFIPYLYSMAWRHHTTAQSLVLPMYYTHPEQPAAYDCPQQYWFGSELIAAPFTSPAPLDTGLSRQSLWLPQGEWFSLFGAQQYRLASPDGGMRLIYGSLDEIPVLAKAGAILPLLPNDYQERQSGRLSSGVENPPALDVLLFPGASNHFDLYEDDGTSNGYAQGKFAITPLDLTWQSGSRANTLTFRIAPVTGDTSLVPAERQYTLRLRAMPPEAAFQLHIDHTLQSVPSTYNPELEELAIGPVTLRPNQELSLEVARPTGYTAPNLRRQQLTRYLTSFRLNSWVKARLDREWDRLMLTAPDPAAQITALRALLQSITALTDTQRSALESIFEA